MSFSQRYNTGLNEYKNRRNEVREVYNDRVKPAFEFGRQGVDWLNQASLQRTGIEVIDEALDIFAGNPEWTGFVQDINNFYNTVDEYKDEAEVLFGQLDKNVIDYSSYIEKIIKVADAVKGPGSVAIGQIPSNTVPVKVSTKPSEGVGTSTTPARILPTRGEEPPKVPNQMRPIYDLGGEMIDWEKIDRMKKEQNNPESSSLLQKIFLPFTVPSVNKDGQFISNGQVVQGIAKIAEDVLRAFKF